MSRFSAARDPDAFGAFYRRHGEAVLRYAVCGLVRANARGVEVRDPAGRVTAAELSAPWTTIRRRRGDLLPIPRRFRDRFRGPPRSLRVCGRSRPLWRARPCRTPRRGPRG